MPRAADRFEELIPRWMFVIHAGWLRAATALLGAFVVLLPLVMTDRPDQLRLGPLVVLVLVVIAAVAGWWPVLLADAILIPAFWYFGVPSVDSFQVNDVGGATAIGGVVVVSLGLAWLTRTVEVSVANVRELDVARQVDTFVHALDYDNALKETSQVRAALALSVRLSELTTATEVAEAALDLLDQPARPSSSSVAVVEDGHLRVLASRNADPSSIAVLERVDIRQTDWLAEVLEGQPAYIDDRERFAVEHPHEGVLRLYRTGSWAVIPFRSEGTLGLLSVHYVEARPLSSYDNYYSLVAESLASALQRAGLDEERVRHLAALEQSFAERDRIARILSTTLVPPRLPVLAGFSTVGWLTPASADEVAGDFYDLFVVPGGGWVGVLGDVCGKGAEAAAVTSLARYAARVSALDDPNPAQIAETANAALNADPSELFCTMALVRYCPKARSIDVTLAGHPQPRILRATGQVERAGTFGAVLGVGVPDYRVDRYPLEPGDSVLLFSDGLIERNAAWGEDELDAALATLRGSADDIASGLRDVLKHVEAHRRDDLAVLVITLDP